MRRHSKRYQIQFKAAKRQAREFDPEKSVFDPKVDSDIEYFPGQNPPQSYVQPIGASGNNDSNRSVMRIHHLHYLTLINHKVKLNQNNLSSSTELGCFNRCKSSCDTRTC